MGKVYRAVDTRLGRQVAIKAVNNFQFEVGSLALREARTLAAIQHPGIVRIYDVISQDNVFWIITEWLDGKTLAQLHGAQPTTVVLAIMKQVFSALEIAHAAHIIHRDIKPSNIMICNDGRVVLIDFGVASVQGFSSGETLAGTLGYADPRILAGEQADTFSDLFSAALIELELMTGQAALPPLAPLPLFRYLNDEFLQTVDERLDGFYPPLAQQCRAILGGRSSPSLSAQTLALTHLREFQFLCDIPLERFLEEWLEEKISPETLNQQLTSHAQEQLLKQGMSPREKASWISFLSERGNQVPTVHVEPAGLEVTVAAGASQQATSSFWKQKKMLVASGAIITAVLFAAPLIILKLRPQQHVSLDENAIVQATPQASPSSPSTPLSSSISPKPSPPSLPKVPVQESAVRQSREVFLVANAWAEIKIDGVAMGRLPRAQPFRLKEGSHEIELQNPFVETLKSTIHVQNTPNLRFFFELKPKLKKVTLRLNSPGSLFVDGIYHGIVLQKELELSMGSHQIHIVRDGINNERRLVISPEVSQEIQLD